MFSLSDAAQRLGVTPQTVKNWGERGILTLNRVGRNYYVSEESVDNLKEQTTDLVGQMNAVEQLREELERMSQTYVNEIKEYKLEMMMRKESTKRIDLYMEIFASLIDLLYEGRYDEREYKAVQSFLKGNSIKEIAESQGVSVSTVTADIRKCNEILFKLQPYTKLQEICRESDRKARLAEKNEEILRAMLTACREEGIACLGELQEDDIEKMMIPVESLNLSLKTKNVLMSGRVKYLGDIVYYGEERLKKIRGFGSFALQEVKRWMSHYNLPIGTRNPVWNAVRKVYGKEKPYVYERLFELDSETREYLETCIEGLPEDRIAEIKELFIGLFEMGECYKERFTKYKQVNLELRDEVLRLEKRLKNEDYYLSPAYEEVKSLFSRIGRMGEWKGRNIGLEESDEPVVKAVGILDCIFNQEAVQAEGKRIQKDEQTIVELEKKVKKLEQQLSEKADKTKRNVGREKEKQVLSDRHVESANLEKINSLQKELEEVRMQKHLLEIRLMNRGDVTTEEMEQLRKECDEALRGLNEIKSQAETDSLLKTGENVNMRGELTLYKIRLLDEQHKNTILRYDMETVERRAREELREAKWKYESELAELWDVLLKYEGQVKIYNSTSFLEKLFFSNRQELYSDYDKKELF